MTKFSRIFLANPAHQIERVKWLITLAREKLLGAPDPFPQIFMTQSDNIWRGETTDGFVWYVVRDEKSLVSWARAFIQKRVRFEDMNLIREGDTVINVGACSGEYTKYAAESVGPNGEVHAFEPDPAHYACLVANMKHYGLHCVRSIQAGASDKERTLKLHRIEDAMAGGSVDDGYRNEFAARITSSVDVPCHRLDSVFAESNKRVRALVVTVNNHELEVLRGAEELLKRTDYVIYQSKFHWQIKEFLESKGFSEAQAFYAGPVGGSDEHTALFQSGTVTEYA